MGEKSSKHAGETRKVAIQHCRLPISSAIGVGGRYEVSATIKSAGRTLTQMAGVLSEFNKTAVIVQGHTDSTGSETHNQDLSERRAQAARNYLVGRGVDPQRVAALGFGESQPVAANDTATDRQRNRRVEVLLKAKA
jgi:outer membrane protein OmpA-like peptidoglycan-associated protein